MAKQAHSTNTSKNGTLSRRKFMGSAAFVTTGAMIGAGVVKAKAAQSPLERLALHYSAFREIAAEIAESYGASSSGVMGMNITKDGTDFFQITMLGEFTEVYGDTSMKVERTIARLTYADGKFVKT